MMRTRGNAYLAHAWMHTGKGVMRGLLSRERGLPIEAASTAWCTNRSRLLSSSTAWMSFQERNPYASLWRSEDACKCLDSCGFAHAAKSAASLRLRAMQIAAMLKRNHSPRSGLQDEPARGRFAGSACRPLP